MCINCAQAILNMIFGRIDIKFYDKMDVPIRMRTIYNVSHCYAISLKSGDKFLYYLTKVPLIEKASICCRYHNVTYFYNKVCITKKYHL